MKAIGYIFTFIFIAVFNAMLSGWALSILWGWFIVPIFNAPALGVAAAIGVALVVQYLTHQNNYFQKSGKSSIEAMIEAISVGISKPLASLLFGWVVLFWV